MTCSGNGSIRHGLFEKATSGFHREVDDERRSRSPAAQPPRLQRATTARSASSRPYINETFPEKQKGHKSVPVVKRHTHPGTTGTFTQCGRHSNEWLFGNISVSMPTTRHGDLADQNSGQGHCKELLWRLWLREMSLEKSAN